MNSIIRKVWQQPERSRGSKHTADRILLYYSSDSNIVPSIYIDARITLLVDNLNMSLYCLNFLEKTYGLAAI